MKSKIALRKYRSTILAVVATFAITAGGFWVFTQIKSHAETNGKTEMQQIVAAVGKHLLLPTDEEPTLATVQDVSKLKGQAIFAKAQNGDKVLVYSKAQKVIVYRPGAQKLVDVGPIVLNKQGSTYLTSRIAIMNGSGNDGATSTMTASVLRAFPNVSIVAKDTAPREFPNTIIIDLKNNQPALNEEIADTLGIKAGQLPLGVAAPDADFLVVIGTDKK